MSWALRRRFESSRACTMAAVLDKLQNKREIARMGRFRANNLRKLLAWEWVPLQTLDIPSRMQERDFKHPGRAWLDWISSEVPPGPRF